LWCWRGKEKISWTDLLKKEEELHRVKEERNVLHAIKRREANSICHILLKTCPLNHIILGKIEGRQK
jgi:hypothetical protein